jgi:hypothetical protein
MSESVRKRPNRKMMKYLGIDRPFANGIISPATVLSHLILDALGTEIIYGRMLWIFDFLVFHDWPL